MKTIKFSTSKLNELKNGQVDAFGWGLMNTKEFLEKAFLNSSDVFKLSRSNRFLKTEITFELKMFTKNITIEIEKVEYDYFNYLSKIGYNGL
jgi:hypothetical protein